MIIISYNEKTSEFRTYSFLEPQMSCFTHRDKFLTKKFLSTQTIHTGYRILKIPFYQSFTYTLGDYHPNAGVEVPDPAQFSDPKAGERSLDSHK
jgi:hypothetical protein